VPNSFDLANDGLRFIPTTPSGWVVVPLGAPVGCADAQQYGDGCIGQFKSFYEQMPAGGFDLTSGTAVTLLRQASGYVVVDAIPGALVPPTAAATNVAGGALDGEQTFALSGPMPIAGGTTSSLTVCTKGYIALSAVGNGIDFTPSATEFLNWSEPAIAPMWHDWDQSAAGSGLILFEEVGGVAYATWNGVFTWLGTMVPCTWQAQFEVATGTITIVYESIANDGPNYLTGYKAGGVAEDRGAFDLSVDLANVIEIGDSDVLPLTCNSNVPRIGTTWLLTTSNIDPVSPVTVTFFGTAPIAVPVPLSAIGFPAPGCFVHINAILGSAGATNVGGSSVVSFPVPNDPLLTGATVAVQSICLTLQNAGNLLTSNAVLGTVGL
jgi:hypothetical protein